MTPGPLEESKDAQTQATDAQHTLLKEDAADYCRSSVVLTDDAAAGGRVSRKVDFIAFVSFKILFCIAPFLQALTLCLSECGLSVGEQDFLISRLEFVMLSLKRLHFSTCAQSVTDSLRSRFSSSPQRREHETSHQNPPNQ
ncbi:unnamed protein product [Pleuronectes platessa]|uniref:Uncharacterized protein n=1 Tax=Pleuronectes platessa TaxID=8262 RepID=A0A9N7Y6B8_PLEPL|nr:unnamed protein product [Pleuronectes platessa]